MNCRLILAMLFGLMSSAHGFAPISAAQGATYTDPFAYCAAVGTIDAPDARFAGAKVPESIARGLRAALGSPAEPLERYVIGSSWRCMDGTVYACNVGANLPCEEQADTSRTPTRDMANYCQSNPNGPVSDLVTSKASVYIWECRNGVAVPDRQGWQVDARGFIANIWHVLSPNDGADAQVMPVAGLTDSTAMLMALGVAAALLGLVFRRRGDRRLKSAFDTAQTR